MRYKIIENTIVEAVKKAFEILNKESSVEEIKETIICNNFYDFRAKEENIDAIIKNQILRHCENVDRKDSIQGEKSFRRTNANLYKLVAYTIIVENDVSQWDDQTGSLYHFPNRYIKYLCPGTKVIYYKGVIRDKKYSSKRLSNLAHYFATATIKKIIEDPQTTKSKYAVIEKFELFTTPLLSKTKNGYLEPIPEIKKANYWRDGVRPITLKTYKNILSNVEEKINVDTITVKPIQHKRFKNFDDLESRHEGKKKQRFTTYYERNSKLRKAAIQIHGLSCKACGFNFEKYYNKYGEDYIQIHHIKPLFENQETKVNPKMDLVPVCANCHVMIHRRKDKTLTIEELQEIIKKKND